MTVEGTCHCGGVTITISVDRPPTDVTSCNCSICRRLGTLWAYYNPKDVRVVGTTVGYQSGDKMLDLHHCPTCACTTHWWPVPDRAPTDRMGINVRLLAPEVLAAARVKRVDGASDTWATLDD
jgi:hypothetical protein